MLKKCGTAQEFLDVNSPEKENLLSVPHWLVYSINNISHYEQNKALAVMFTSWLLGSGDGKLSNNFN